MQRRAFERRGGIPVKPAKCGAKVTVAGETEIQGQGRQIAVAGKKVECAGQAKPQLVAR